LKYILMLGIRHKKKMRIDIKQKKSCLPKKLSSEKPSNPSKYVTE